MIHLLWRTLSWMCALVVGHMVAQVEIVIHRKTPETVFSSYSQQSLRPAPAIRRTRES